MTGYFSELFARKRLADRISVAVFVAGLSFAAQAEHCVEGTLCYPDPGDMCGPSGPVWCGGDDGSGLPQAPFQISIPHMRDNPYDVSCGVSDQAQMLRSLSFDILSFSRSNNNYSDWFGSDPYPVNLSGMAFYMNYSDGSYVILYSGGASAPGQYDASVFNNPVGTYQESAGYWWPAPTASLWLGPDAYGYAFNVSHIGLHRYDDPNPPSPQLCLKPFT